MKKVMMVIYIRNLDETSLASPNHEYQKQYQWPGLAKQTKHISQDIGIEN